MARRIAIRTIIMELNHLKKSSHYQNEVMNLIKFSFLSLHPWDQFHLEQLVLPLEKCPPKIKLSDMTFVIRCLILGWTGISYLDTEHFVLVFISFVENHAHIGILVRFVWILDEAIAARIVQNNLELSQLEASQIVELSNERLQFIR